MLNRLDRSIGVGENVTKKLKTKFNIPENKAITINNGVDINTFHENRKTSLSKKQLGLESNDKVTGMVANFWIVKNHIFLTNQSNPRWHYSFPAAAVFNVEAVFPGRVLSITDGAVPAVCRQGLYCRLTGQDLLRSFVCADISPVEVGH